MHVISAYLFNVYVLTVYKGYSLRILVDNLLIFSILIDSSTIVQAPPHATYFL